MVLMEALWHIVVWWRYWVQVLSKSSKMEIFSRWRCQRWNMCLL
uniref:Uncharacterized protein n=1 Tax=Arundo donax TaxID=35708 RepID=A0A0A9B5V8_ARUDO